MCPEGESTTTPTHSPGNMSYVLHIRGYGLDLLLAWISG